MTPRHYATVHQGTPSRTLRLRSRKGHASCTDMVEHDELRRRYGRVNQITCHHQQRGARAEPRAAAEFQRATAAVDPAGRFVSGQSEPAAVRHGVGDDGSSGADAAAERRRAQSTTAADAATVAGAAGQSRSTGEYGETGSRSEPRQQQSESDEP